MNFDQESMGVRISMPVIRREVNSDISEDYTLPDYYPEIRKLLFARPSPLLPAKFVSGTKVDVSGVVDYTLIYLSADGKLCSAPLSAEYSFSLPVENMNEFELGEGLDVMAHTVAESTSVRVSAPRRIQLRSHLRTSLSVFGKKLCAERITGLCEGADIERLRAKGESCELLCESSDVISLEDSFELGENERIALADGIVALKDQRVSGETIRFDGEILIWMLAESQDGAQRDISRRLPLEAEIELDGVSLPENAGVRASGYLTDLSINVEEGRVSISADAVIEVCACANREFEYTKDAYSVSQKSECETAERSVPICSLNANSSLSLCERMSLEELGYPPDARPLEAFATASVDSVSLEDGKYVLRGTCRYSVISMRDGEYVTGEFSVPFRYERDAGDETSAPFCFDGVATVRDAKVKAESDALCFECELLLSATVLGGQRISMLEKIELSDKEEQRSGELIVCYPQGDDTLWSVAKRYSVLREEISGDPVSDAFIIIEA